MRRPILTKQVMASIPAMVANGLRAPVIAEQLGCKLATLKVRCSQERISLRIPGARPAKRPKAIVLTLPVEAPLQLSRDAVARLHKQATTKGCTAVQLASELLEVIAQDNLYDAVLDR